MYSCRSRSKSALSRLVTAASLAHGKNNGVEGAHGAARGHVPNRRGLSGRPVRARMYSPARALPPLFAHVPPTRQLFSVRASQGILGKELCRCQGGLPQGSDPRTREQWHPGEAHGRLRCAVARTIAQSLTILFPDFSLPAHRFSSPPPLLLCARRLLHTHPHRPLGVLASPLPVVPAPPLLPRLLLLCCPRQSSAWRRLSTWRA